MNDKNLPGIVTKAAMRLFGERVKGKR